MSIQGSRSPLLHPSADPPAPPFFLLPPSAVPPPRVIPSDSVSLSFFHSRNSLNYENAAVFGRGYCTTQRLRAPILQELPRSLSKHSGVKGMSGAENEKQALAMVSWGQTRGGYSRTGAAALFEKKESLERSSSWEELSNSMLVADGRLGRSVSCPSKTSTKKGVYVHPLCPPLRTSKSSTGSHGIESSVTRPLACESSDNLIRLLRSGSVVDISTTAKEAEMSLLTKRSDELLPASKCKKTGVENCDASSNSANCGADKEIVHIGSVKLSGDLEASDTPATVEDTSEGQVKRNGKSSRVLSLPQASNISLISDPRTPSSRGSVSSVHTGSTRSSASAPCLEDGQAMTSLLSVNTLEEVKSKESLRRRIDNFREVRGTGTPPTSGRTAEHETVVVEKGECRNASNKIHKEEDSAADALIAAGFPPCVFIGLSRAAQLGLAEEGQQGAGVFERIWGDVIAREAAQRHLPMPTHETIEKIETEKRKQQQRAEIEQQQQQNDQEEEGRPAVQSILVCAGREQVA